MRIHTSVIVMLSSVICLLLKTAKATGFHSIEVTAKVPESHERNLSCHSCTRSTHGENCLTMLDKTALDIEHCPLEKKFCKVERYWQDGVLTTFSRECAAKCKPGCIETGSLYVLKYCYDCCRSNAFCNIRPYEASSGAAFTTTTTTISAVTVQYLSSVIFMVFTAVAH